MIKVKINGKDKTYFVKCYKCGSDLLYTLDDVIVEPLKLDENGEVEYERSIIKCPVCGKELCAYLKTEEEEISSRRYCVPFSCRI